MSLWMGWVLVVGDVFSFIYHWYRSSHSYPVGELGLLIGLRPLTLQALICGVASLGVLLYEAEGIGNGRGSRPEFEYPVMVGQGARPTWTLVLKGYYLPWINKPKTLVVERGINFYLYITLPLHSLSMWNSINTHPFKTNVHVDRAPWPAVARYSNLGLGPLLVPILSAPYNRTLRLASYSTDKGLKG